MEEIKLFYYILGIAGTLVGLIGNFFWQRFETKQVRKDLENSITQIEITKLANVEALREIYDQKIQDSKNYAKGLFEQRADSINNLQVKVDKIEAKLENMPTQKSVDEINERLTNLISLIMSQHNTNPMG